MHEPRSNSGRSPPRATIRIPLLAECLADLDTPLSLYVKLIDRAKRREQLPARVGGRRRALRALLVHRAAGAHAAARERRRDRGGPRRRGRRDRDGDPLEFVRAYHARFKVALRPGLPRFPGGLAGYFAYDVVRWIEPRLGASSKPDPIGTPDVLMLLVDELAIVDKLRGKLYCSSTPTRRSPTPTPVRSAAARAAGAPRAAGDRARGRALPEGEIRRGVRARRLPRGGRPREGVHRRRRRDAGAGRPVPEGSPMRTRRCRCYRALRSINRRRTCTTTTSAASR